MFFWHFSMHTNILLTQITEILKNKLGQNLNTSLEDQELIHMINIVIKQDFSCLTKSSSIHQKD